MEKNRIIEDELGNVTIVKKKNRNSDQWAHIKKFKTLPNSLLTTKNQCIQNDKDIFDTLSDVSTNESDIEITSISGKKESILKALPRKSEKNDKIVITLDSDSDTEPLSKISNKSIDYLISPPECYVVREIDYTKCELSESQFPFSSSSSDTSDSDALHEVISLDNNVSFILDGQLSIDLSGNAKNTSNDSIVNVENSKRKRKRKSQKRFPNNPELRDDNRMFKYWSQRYDLFERFDMGIKLDKESWYSVTPEYIAKEQAELCNESDTILDAFCGAGGNTIQFSYKCHTVLALDIDPIKVELTKKNCFVYGVDMTKVSIMKDNFYLFAEQYKSSDDFNNCFNMPKIDVVFLSPPWGGQNYLLNDDNDDSNDIESQNNDVIDMDKLMNTARLFRPSTIIVYLPRNTDQTKLKKFLRPNETMDIVKHQSRYRKCTKKIKAITVVYKVVS